MTKTTAMNRSLEGSETPNWAHRRVGEDFVSYDPSRSRKGFPSIEEAKDAGSTTTASAKTPGRSWF